MNDWRNWVVLIAFATTTAGAQAVIQNHLAEDRPSCCCECGEAQEGIAKQLKGLENTPKQLAHLHRELKALIEKTGHVGDFGDFPGDDQPQ